MQRTAENVPMAFSVSEAGRLNLTHDSNLRRP